MKKTTLQLSARPIYRQSAVVAVHREKIPGWVVLDVRPIRGVEGCAVSQKVATASLSARPIYRQSVVVVGHREKTPDG